MNYTLLLTSPKNGVLTNPVFNAITVYNGTNITTGISYNWLLPMDWSGSYSSPINSQVTITFIPGGGTKNIYVATTYAGLADNDLHTVWVYDNCKIQQPVSDRQLILDIFPNPAHNFINFRIGNFTTITTLEIFDIQGEIIYQSNVTSDNGIIVLSSLSSGIYLVRLKDDLTFVTKMLNVTN